MSKKIIITLSALVFCLWTLPLNAQAIRDASGSNVSGGSSNNIEIPLRRVVILTSGLAYYEHSGPVDGSVSFRIPFSFNAVNDALKSLVINDPSTSNPSVTYQSENMLHQTLQSLQIDLSGEPRMDNILSRLRGAEVRIANGGTNPVQVTGRIISVEYNHVFTNEAVSFVRRLLLSTNQGIMSFNMEDITAIFFTDPSIERDLNRGLDLIAASRVATSRDLTVNLPGSGRRDVNISYVIPSPVWKVSYRLDLSGQTPRFQGWAIIDNDSDNDWNEVELSLVAGRPVSFIQNLYPPYYVMRPVLPLSIAGTAEAIAHERSFDQSFGAAPAPSTLMRVESMADYAVSEEAEMPRMRIAAPQANVTGAVMEGAGGSEAAGQFEFTIRHPVTLNRRTSAMLPLVDTAIEAGRILFYNGSGRHPRLGARIKNTSSMKLPAGPVTVFDGGVYAGDALIEFWNEGEERIISFGEDLSVTAAVTDSSTRAVSSVNISGGVMTISRALIFNKTYTFINSAETLKPIIIEHSRTAQTELVSPSASEETTGAYRFDLTLNANRETVFTVSERRIISERITLLSQRLDSLLSYSSNQEIPQNVRTVLQRAVDLRRAADAAEAAVRDVEASRNRIIADQDRIRRNLEAAGSQTQQGADFLARLAALDREIDAMTANLENARAASRAAQQAFNDYINSLNI